MMMPRSRQMTAGMPVKKKSKPGPMGLGLGSGQRPRVSRKIILRSGLQPKRTRRSPMMVKGFLNQRDIEVLYS